MGRYYFHLFDDYTVIDEEGLELSGPDVARDKGQAMAREMACAEVLEGHLNLNHRIEIVGEDSQPVATVHFSDTVRVET
jgi:hypothetical protein